MQYLLTHLLVTLSPSLFDFGAWFIQIELQETGHVCLCLGFLLLWGSWEQDAGSPGEFSLWPGNWVGSDFHWVGGEGASHWGALLCIFALFPRGCLFWGPRWYQFPCGGGAQRWWMVVLLGQALCLVCRSLKTWVFAKKSLFLHGDKRASLNLSPQMQSLRIFADSKSRVFQGIGIAEGLEEKPGSLSSGQVCSNVTAHRACVQKVTALPRSPGEDLALWWQKFSSQVQASDWWFSLAYVPSRLPKNNFSNCNPHTSGVTCALSFSVTCNVGGEDGEQNHLGWGGLLSFVWVSEGRPASSSLSVSDARSGEVTCSHT